MSLQIWLPLNGNLTNQGINSSAFTSSATYDNNGKIGKCLSSNIILSVQDNLISKITLKNQYSFALWMKSKNSSGWAFRFGDVNGNTSSNSRGMWININANYEFAFSSSGTAIGPASTICDNNWHHIVYTVDDKSALIYVDGKLVQNLTLSYNQQLNYEYIQLNGNTNYINDFRIYDHCLSLKEVQELAKGLVLHYRLAGPGQENIIEHSHNGSGWSIGSGWTAFTDGDGTKGYRFTRTGATSNNWVRVIPPTKINPNDYPEGITVSMDIKTPNISAINHTCVGALQIYNSTGTRSGWCEPHWDLSKVKNNVWTRVSYFFTQAQLKTISQSGMTYSYTMFSFQLVQNGDISIKNFKAERGNVRTPWTPNKADAAWTTMGYSNNIEYDCSGYGNNGTIKYPPVWDVNSPRYTTSYKFDGTAYLTIPNPFPIGTVVREFSHTAWIKWDSACNTNNGIHSISYSNSFFRFALGKGSKIWTYGIRCNADGSGESETSILTHGALSSLVHNKWYFIAITFKDGVCKAYLDGEQVASTTSTLVGLKSKTSNGAIGAYMPEGNEPAIGNISDSRFYVTELSAEDIQELYHSAVIIDNTGKTYAYEYFEG